MNKYKYIEFIIKEQKPKTKVFSCLNINNQYELGIVKWHGPWRQYCYFPTTAAMYSQGCMKDISSFIKELKNGN